jgi:hypothetical protein
VVARFLRFGATVPGQLSGLALMVLASGPERGGAVFAGLSAGAAAASATAAIVMARWERARGVALHIDLDRPKVPGRANYYVDPGP